MSHINRSEIYIFEVNLLKAALADSGLTKRQIHDAGLDNLPNNGTVEYARGDFPNTLSNNNARWRAFTVKAKSPNAKQPDLPNRPKNHKAHTANNENMTPVNMNERHTMTTTKPARSAGDQSRLQIKEFYPKGEQNKVWDQIHQNSLSIILGAAGTGKTRMAVQRMFELLKQGEISQVWFLRPAVGADGKELGTVPGDQKEKTEPFVAPLRDVVEEIIGKEAADALERKGILHFATPIHLRGKNLDDAGLVVDEGQNLTRAELELLITRPKARDPSLACQRIITGDIDQNDLAPTGLAFEVKKCEMLALAVDLTDTLKDCLKVPGASLGLKTFAMILNTGAAFGLHYIADRALLKSGMPYLQIWADKIKDTTEYKLSVIEMSGAAIYRDHDSRQLARLGLIGGRRQAELDQKEKISSLLNSKPLPASDTVRRYFKLPDPA